MTHGVGAGTGGGARAHHRSIAQPHRDSQGPIGVAEAQAAGLVSVDEPLGPLGPPVDRQAAFRRGAAATAGAVGVLAGAGLVVVAHRELVLIVLAFFLALGGEPVVSWLARHRWPRAVAVTAVVVVALAAVAGFVSLVAPVIAEQAGQLPELLRGLQDPHTLLGRLNTRFGVQGAVQQYLSEGGSSGLLSAGQAVSGALGSGLVVAVLAVYFLADLPRIRRTLYLLRRAGEEERDRLRGGSIGKPEDACQKDTAMGAEPDEIASPPGPGDLSLSHRDRALLREVAAGHCEVADDCGPVLTIGGRCCCDQLAARRLTRAGLVERPSSAEPRPARLTATGHLLLQRSPDGARPEACRDVVGQCPIGGDSAADRSA